MICDDGYIWDYEYMVGEGPQKFHPWGFPHTGHFIPVRDGAYGAVEQWSAK